MSKLTKAAQVGNTIFNVGVDERMVVERAQREHDYQQTPEKEAERIKRVHAFQNALTELQVGTFTLRPGVEPGRIWIECESGEGGDFDPAKLEKVIAAFYKEHF